MHTPILRKGLIQILFYPEVDARTCMSRWERGA